MLKADDTHTSDYKSDNFVSHIELGKIVVGILIYKL